MNRLEDLSKEELVEALRDAQADLERARSAIETERVVHDLQVHQIELEMQNRELRESQAALEESRARYADLYDFAPVAYCTLEKDGRIHEANLSATAWFGLDRSALLGKPLSSLVVLEDRPALRNHLRRCLQDKSRVTTELRMLVPGLGPTSFQLVSTPMLTAAGVVTGCKTAITDISQLKRSEERLQLLADASLALTRSFDVAENLGLVVRSLVPAMADLCFADLFDDEQSPSGARRVAVVAADPSKQAVAEALRRPPTPRSTLTEPVLLTDGADGALSHVVGDEGQRQAVVDACAPKAVMMVPMTSRGRPVGLLGFVMADASRTYGNADMAFAKDLAARAAMAVDNAQLYSAAERARQIRQDILAIVSHELRNPLTGISLSAEVLLQAAPSDDRRQGRVQVDRIKRGVRHMQNLIDDLLDFNALETGRLSVDPRPTAVASILDEAVELLAPVASEKKLRLEQGPARDLAALCDKNRCVQVLSNLIGNALKFTPEGGKITVSADALARERQVRFAVHDTGPGLPKQVMLNLFQRYWQAKETASKGRGLGLFIAKGIVEAQGGAIWVESSQKEGTTFYFTVPLARLDEVSTRAEAPAGSPLVMVVDDDANTRDIVTDILAEKSYTVVQAANGEEAMKYLKSGKPQPRVMLLDLLMPVMDGRELMGALKKDSLLSNIPVVLVSSVPNIKAEVQTLGALDALPKPIDVDRLLNIVSKQSLTRPEAKG